MKLIHRNIFAATSLVVCCCTTSTHVLAQVATPNTRTASSIPSQTRSDSKDDTNSSPRERGRILVKRNPIASEYQVFGDMGTAPGADADGEAVDFRSFFPTINPLTNLQNSLQLGYTLNYNDQSGIGKSGYNARWNKVIGPSEDLVVSFQIRKSSSDRLIEHYESVWQERGDDSDHYLDRPRFSYDDFLTENTVTSAQAGYRLSDNHSIYFKTYHQDYFDNSYRNRLELQLAGADLVAGSEEISPDGSATAATFENASTRRYFGDTDNNRTRIHHTFGGSYEGNEWSIDYALYSQKWNLDRLWHNWNFRESGLDLTYTIENPYKPTFTELEGTDFLDESKSQLSSLRIHQNHTRDRDLAARVDAERSLLIGDQQYWIQTGILYREKERETWQDLEVYFSSSNDPLYLTDVNNGSSDIAILDGAYQMPAGLNATLGREAIANNPEYFVQNAYRERVESAPQSYSAEESVASTYLLATRTIGDWTFEAGGRIERTKTATRGTVVIPESVNDPSEGVQLDTIVNPSDNSLLVIKDIYSENNYTDFIPSAEAAFKLNEENTFRAAWFSLLMRPQYFNIVDYRRISIPTQNISEGNPNLSPTNIDKLRLSWTRENESLGSFSLEGYLINIENFFYGSVSDEVILEDGVPQIYRVSRVENGGKASVKGFEIQWQKSVDDFATFDRASATLAYTYSDSEAAVQSRPDDELPTPERSKHLLKLSLSGEISRLKSAIDFTYQSKALDDLGSSYDQDEYREDVIGLVFRNNFRIDDKTTLSLNFSNLTDHPERSYEGSPLRVSRNQYSSWSGTLGVTHNF